MRRPIRPAAARGGFTLVELLVAAALALVVMTILAFAFQTGLGTLSQLRSVVGLADQLRSAEEIIKRDLGDPVIAPHVYHLETDRGDRLRLSGLAPTDRPARGYFRLAQYSRPFQGELPNPWAGATPAYGMEYDNNPWFDPLTPAPAPRQFRGYWYEGNDDNLSALSSFRATDHVLQFTVRLPSVPPAQHDDVFTANLPPKLWDKNWPANRGNPVLAASLPGYDPTGTKFVSKWAEVSYHLEPRGQFTVDASDPAAGSSATAGQMPVYALVRRQRVLAPPGSSVQVPPTIPAGPYPSANQPFTVVDLQSAPDLAFSAPSPPSEPNYVLNTPDAGRINVFAADPGNGIALRAQHRIGGRLDALGAGSVPATDPRLDRPYSIPATSPEYGSDVLLNNVLSMQVRVLTSLPPNPNHYADPPLNSLPTTPPPPAPAVTPPINSVPTGSHPDAGMIPPRQQGNPVRPIVLGGGFDTAVIREGQVPDNSGNPQYFQYPVKAIQIKLRVYDAKNKITRQMTIVQDL
ncbi:MAG: prepilin-type N-terminal cleavage/methylation domain-containing protein [Gemmataceae bacterium]